MQLGGHGIEKKGRLRGRGASVPGLQPGCVHRGPSGKLEQQKDRGKKNRDHWDAPDFR